MRIPALLLTTLFAGLLAACADAGNPPPPPPPAATVGWGQPIASSAASAPMPLRVHDGPPLQCVPEGGDCAGPQAGCCAGFTCAGLNHSICISKH